MTKKTISIFISILITATVFGQTEKETIRKANNLIKNKKYESAFKLLTDFDPKNTNVEIVLLKEEIALNYYVSSIMHRIFALKDLENNEDVMDYRGKAGNYDMQMFEIDKVLDSLIKIYPANCELYKGLGNFYYEVQMNYDGKWIMSDSTLFQLIETNNKKAIEGKCADFFTYYILGYTNIAQEKYKEAIPYFLKSIEMNKEHVNSYYNVAFGYLYSDDLANALKYAKLSFSLYTDSSYKSDAARMMGQIYTEMKDEKSALANFELANNIDPDNYDNIKPLLYLYVKTGDAKTKETTKLFFELDPVNPTMDDDLEEIYFDNKKENNLADFYKEELNVFKDNDTITGNLNFYLGKLYLDSNHKLAKDYFLKSREIFSKLFDKDHPVFQAIEEGIAEAGK